MPRQSNPLTVQDIASEGDVLTRPTSRHWPFDDTGFAPLASLRREMDDVFSQISERFAQTNGDGRQVPALDVTETDSEFEITAEMPGVAEADVDVSITDNVVSITGEKSKTSDRETANSRISERQYGRYERSIRLPVACKATDITAEYENGVLHLSIPKPDEKKVKPQSVKIKTKA